MSMWDWIRCRALILAVVPFVIAGSLWFLSQKAGGWYEPGFFLILILSRPVLAGMAAFAVIFAFRREDGIRRLEGVSKVASLSALVVFGGVVLTGSAGII
ncbi:hypothetical protein [Arthrobacter glacialis]|uniref:hypothetical protein n=1 Tax=Arthrobacter glacialis TaxID=1664 RepID=UPI0010572721|nr:hypothetical protein [Arthrobacter glacialis]